MSDSFSLDKLHAVIRDMENKYGKSPTIVVGSLSMFDRFTQKMCSESGIDLFISKPTIAQASILGLEVHEDTSLPFHAFVIEDGNSIKVFDMLTGGGMGVSKNDQGESGIEIRTPEDRLEIVHLMLWIIKQRGQNEGN